MRRIYIVPIILILFCISCNKNNPQDRDDRTEIWRPKLISIRDDSSVELFWLNPVIYEKILRTFTYIDPDRFEIYMSQGDPQHMAKIADLDNDKQYSYKIINLTNSLNYFFSVKAIKHGKEPLVSDTIMVMPSIPEILHQLTDNTNFPMESGSISKDNQIIAYVNRSFTWDNGKYGDMSLFALNLSSKENFIIDTSSYFPDWSPTEKKVVYCSDKHEVSNANGRPQHLFIYDFNTATRIKLTQGDYFDINPDFSPDGNWIVYSSDEGQHGIFNFWKISWDGSRKTKLTNNLNLTSLSIGNVALGRPLWSSDGNSIFFNILSENNSQNGIFKINLNNGNIDPIIKSRWEDMCPSSSPDNYNIAFVSNRSGNNQIWVYNLSTKLFRQITGSKGTNLNTDWGKIEWINEKKLLYSGYSYSDSKETIFTIDLK